MNNQNALWFGKKGRNPAESAPKYPTHGEAKHHSCIVGGGYDCCHYGDELDDECFCDAKCGRPLKFGKYSVWEGEGGGHKCPLGENAYAFCIDCVIKAIQTLK